jgi:hypothetical protein
VAGRPVPADAAGGDPVDDGPVAGMRQVGELRLRREPRIRQNALILFCLWRIVRFAAVPSAKIRARVHVMNIGLLVSALAFAGGIATGAAFRPDRRQLSGEAGSSRGLRRRTNEMTERR